MMNTTDRRDEIVEVEANLEEDINHHPRTNTHQEPIEILGAQKTETLLLTNIGINQMKIRTTTPATPEITKILRILKIANEKIQPLLEIRLMREEKKILNLKTRNKLGNSSKIMKAITKSRSLKNL